MKYSSLLIPYLIIICSFERAKLRISEQNTKENRIFLWIIELTSEVSPTIFPSSSHSFPQIMGLTWDLLGTYLGSPHQATNRHPEGIPKASRRKYVSFIDQIPTEHLSNIGRWKESDPMLF